MATSIKTKATFLMGQNNANSQVYVHIVPSQQTIAIRAGVGNVAYVAFPFAGMEDEQIQQSFSEAPVYFIGQDGGRSLFQNKADTTNIVIEVRQNKAMLTDVDLAIQADPVESRVDNGGMDFNAIGKDMQIQMNSDGFVFPKIDPAMLDQFQTEGFEIRAIQIRPLGMPVLRQMIGLAPEEKESDSSSESKPMELSYVKEN
jgi:hypothetical protein